jgi:hypothetical protein
MAASRGAKCAFRRRVPVRTLAAFHRPREKPLRRTLEEIRHEHGDSPVLRGLVRLLNDKLQLRARYAFLDYEAAQEGRSQCSELYRVISRIEAEQIARVSAALVAELQSANGTVTEGRDERLPPDSPGRDRQAG